MYVCDVCNAHQVLLFDEFEKAHRDVSNLMLQVPLFFIFSFFWVIFHISDLMLQVPVLACVSLWV